MRKQVRRGPQRAESYLDTPPKTPPILTNRSLALASPYPNRNTRRKAERVVPLGAVGRNKPAVYLDTLSITPFILTDMY